MAIIAQIMVGMIALFQIPKEKEWNEANNGNNQRGG